MTDTALHEEEYHGQLNPGLWWKIIRLGRRQWPAMAAMVFMAMVMATLDLCFTLVTRKMINDVAARGQAANLLLWGGLFVGMVCGFAVGVFTFINLGARISPGISHDMRQAGFEKLQELSFSYYDRRPVGWLMARLTSDCDRLSRILAWGVLDLIWGVFMLVGVSVLLLAFQWQLGLLVLIVVPPMTWVSMIFQKRILATDREARRANSNITAAYNESISGVRTTKTLVREADNLAEFRVLTGLMYDASVRNAIWSSVYLPVIFSLGSVGVAVALWKGGMDVMNHGMTIGDLYLFLAYAAFFFMPVQELSRMFVELQAVQAAAERIVGLLETEPEIRDTPEVVQAVERFAREHPSGAAGMAPDGLPDGIDTIEFSDVHFAYKQGQKVLDGFNLSVRSGQTIALVGPTGGGKTTIVSLMCRFYEPTAGEILINGIDYRRRPLRWLQSQLGIVLQTPHLFTGPVRENIRYGRLDATDAEVEQASRLVNAHEFVMRLDQGYDTDVGHGGNKLSTGQKQLIALARAVLADPRIFIMDEATSSVDTETERLIQAGIDNILHGRLSFVVAHRLSTIRSASRILMIEAGRIVEDGTHRQLIRARGRYYDLYTNQFARQKEEEILQAPATPA
jgi:ATP-binding cassette subfamily B protein